MAEAALSDHKRELLKLYLRQGAAARSHVDPVVTPRPSGVEAPLTLSQEQLVLRQDQIIGSPALYNESIVLRMRGHVDSSVLASCLSEIICRHEIWRTSYRRRDGQLRQQVHPPGEFDLETIDLKRLSRIEQEATIREILVGLVREPFDLANGPLLRAVLLRLSESEQRLCLIAHLSVVDGMSVYQIFPTELCALYLAFSAGRQSPLPDLRLQYGDYAYWQRQIQQEAERERQIEYWRKRFDGRVPILNWPKDKERPSLQTFRGAIRSFDVPRELVQTVKALNKSESVSLFLTFLTAFAVLLHVYTDQEAVVIGTPSPAGRDQRELQGLLGYFLNPVALRFDLDENPKFHELLRHAKTLLLEALVNDDVPLELLARELKVPGDPSRNPFFMVAMSQQPALPHFDLDWTVTSMDFDSGGTPWDLYIAFIDQPQATVARVQYSTDLFAVEDIDRMMTEYYSLLELLAGNPSLRVSEARSSLNERKCGALARVVAGDV